MEVIIQKDAAAAASLAARLIADTIRAKPNAVLGLATGRTMENLYGLLADMHRTEGLDFAKVRTFNLDEYLGLAPDHPQSYHHFMWENLFRHLNIAPENVHIPDGNAKDIPGFCAAYEQRIRDAGGIDLQVLGIGTDGHIGFNEPTSSLASRTRIKTLTPQTRRDNARFFASLDEVPTHCITMGIGTIMEARHNLMLAFGANKAHAIAEAVEGPITAINPASILQMHPDAKFCLDTDAAAELQRVDYYRWVYDNKPEWQHL